MVHSRLSDSGGARSVLAVLANLKSNTKVVILLSRLSLLASDSGKSRPLVERVLSQDSQANTRVCELLSSAMYSENAQVYGSVSQAIDALGLDTVSIASQSLSLQSIAQTLGPPAGINASEFCRHAIATSCAAGVLANCIGIDKRSAQTAGLVHNLGILFCAGTFQPEYKKLGELLSSKSVDLHRAELDLFGFDHQDAARIVLPAFGFEQNVVTAAAEHHAQPAKMTPLSRCVSMAGLVSDQLGCTFGFGRGGAEHDHEAVSEYGFSNEQLGLAAESVTNSVARMSRCLP